MTMTRTERKILKSNKMHDLYRMRDQIEEAADFDYALYNGLWHVFRGYIESLRLAVKCFCTHVSLEKRAYVEVDGKHS